MFGLEGNLSGGGTLPRSMDDFRFLRKYEGSAQSETSPKQEEKEEEEGEPFPR
jgi:hypothetical protein